ncbi:putative sulfate exporter family transporter [Paenibacillus filicis]|uniref:Sulfate exporter family transporter n=1 Tax=Paenibacillus filicis TaxID=669464 RepID=A0ABU9DJ04_9BACL
MGRTQLLGDYTGSRRRVIQWGIMQGIGLTLLLAALAWGASGLPHLGIVGPLVLAIILGMAWRATVGVGDGMTAGIAFSSQKLLRLGIILLGMRLDWRDLVHAGPQVAAMAVIHVMFTLTVVALLARRFGVGDRLGLLTACGTAICGAAAVAAIAPQAKATPEETAIAAAIAAIWGTVFTVAYTLLYPVLGLTAGAYGIFSGATLHEVAHAIAASAVAGQEAVDLAVVAKLSRVALLVPVALLVGLRARRAVCSEAGANSGAQVQAERSPIPVPWFILSFLAMSGLHTWGIIPAAAAGYMVTASYLLMAMAMAGLGLNVRLSAFRRQGMKPLAASLLGSVLLALLGYVLIYGFGLSNL